MKYFLIIFLCPIICYSQANTNSKLYLGHNRNCFGGIGSCLEKINGDVDLNPAFTVTKSNNVLALKTDAAELIEEQQIALIGRSFEDLEQNETMKFTLPSDHIFDDYECRVIGVPLMEGWGVREGQYDVYFDDEGMLIVIIQINRFQL